MVTSMLMMQVCTLMGVGVWSGSNSGRNFSSSWKCTGQQLKNTVENSVQMHRYPTPLVALQSLTKLSKTDVGGRRFLVACLIRRHPDSPLYPPTQVGGPCRSASDEVAIQIA